jgi:hypothetical protein
MENKKKSKLFEEGLRKFNYRVGYKINETVKYHSLVNDGEEFDDVPLTNEAGDQEDAPIPGGGNTPPAPSNDQPVGMDAPVPAFDKTGGEEQLNPNVPPAANPMGDMNAPVEPQPEVDDIQNDIIKHNIEAMKAIHDKLESLNNMTVQLNAKLDTLSADVEEVREPTNSEKLMSKTNVSYPYYFNLNDFWKGNWFNEKRENQMQKGINELPDGSFVADFDDLPQKSKIDVQNSFNEIYESFSRFRVGTKVKVSDGSGLDSNKTGIVVSPREVKIDGSGIPVNVSGAYKPVDWKREIAVKFDDGSLITMFKNRLSII